MPEPQQSAAEPQAGAAVEPQAGKPGAGGDNPPAGESISLEKAKELRSENKNLRDRLKAL